LPLVRSSGGVRDGAVGRGNRVGAVDGLRRQRRRRAGAIDDQTDQPLKLFVQQRNHAANGIGFGLKHLLRKWNDWKGH